jgi:prohibitin 1
MGYNENSRYSENKEGSPIPVRKAFLTGSVLIALGLILAIICFFMFSTKVHPGYAGIVYNQNGGIEPIVLSQGRHIVWPTQHVIEYPVSTEVAYYTSSEHGGRKTDESLIIGTRDGKTMKVDAQVTYHMEKDGLPHIFNTFKGANSESIEYGYMRQNYQRIVNDLSSQYTMMDIVGEKKAEFNSKLFILVRDFFAENYITVEQSGLGKVEPDEATKAAIQAVANAQYAEKQAQYEKQVAIAQAQKQVEQARGYADSRKIEADATAYVNAKVQQSMTKELVELEWIKKWNGVLPQYQLGSGQGMMLNMGK